MRYTIKEGATGGFDIIDLKSGSVAAHLPTVEAAATRLTELVRPDLNPEHEVADRLMRLRNEVYSNVEAEFQRRLDQASDEPIPHL